MEDPPTIKSATDKDCESEEIERIVRERVLNQYSERGWEDSSFLLEWCSFYIEPCVGN